LDLVPVGGKVGHGLAQRELLDDGCKVGVGGAGVLACELKEDVVVAQGGGELRDGLRGGALVVGPERSVLEAVEDGSAEGVTQLVVPGGDGPASLVLGALEQTD